MEANIFKLGVDLEPSIIAKNTPNKLLSFPPDFYNSLFWAKVSISSISNTHINQGINEALSAISLSIRSESPTIPLLKSPAAIGKQGNIIYNLSQMNLEIADFPVPGGPWNKIPFGV